MKIKQGMQEVVALSLALVACGGEPFDADSADIEQMGGADSAAVAGSDTGDARAGYAGTAAGGSSSTAGKPAAGSSPGGSPSTGGQPTAGTGTGGSAPSCEFDETKLTALLPMSFVWESFTYTSGEFCVKCRDMPCDTLNVISWGVPTLDQEGGYTYSPNAEAPMVSVELGVNDGTCASEKSCGVKMYFGSVRFLVAPGGSGWVVSAVMAAPQGTGNACLDSYQGGGSTSSVAGSDFAKEIEASLGNLEIPCN